MFTKSKLRQLTCAYWYEKFAKDHQHFYSTTKSWCKLGNIWYNLAHDQLSSKLELKTHEKLFWNLIFERKDTKSEAFLWLNAIIFVWTASKQEGQPKGLGFKVNITYFWKAII